MSGTIDALIPVPSGVKGLENLVVASRQFEYSDFVLSPGLNETYRQRAGLAVGQYVQIDYLDGVILRVRRCPRRP